MIEVKNLKKHYKHREVLKDINFNLSIGEIKALVGPNGSGKTTLMKSITAILKKDAGQVLIENIERNHEDIFNYISFFQDENILDKKMFGLDYLNYIKKIYKLKDRDVEKIISEIDIKGFINTKIGTYSLGMKKKLLLAMAFLPNNKYIFLDEPLSGLDPTSVIRVKEFLQNKANNTSILISSHNLLDIDDITDNILFLKDGFIIEEKLDSKSFLTIKTSDDEKLNLILQNRGIVYSKNGIDLKNININDILKIIFDANLEILKINTNTNLQLNQYRKPIPMCNTFYHIFCKHIYSFT